MKSSEEKIYKNRINIEGGEYLSTCWVREDGFVYRTILGEGDWISTEFMTSTVLDSYESFKDESRELTYWFPEGYKEKLS
jgi:hypothetical protein